MGGCPRQLEICCASAVGVAGCDSDQLPIGGYLADPAVSGVHFLGTRWSEASSAMLQSSPPLRACRSRRLIRIRRRLDSASLSTTREQQNRCRPRPRGFRSLGARHGGR